jgi:hypothetical protein
MGINCSKLPSPSQTTYISDAIQNFSEGNKEPELLISIQIN